MLMTDIRRFFKKKPDMEYWIPINDVIITYDFQLSSPRITKFTLKEREFLKNGILGKIILNQNFELVDGYCSYLICKKHGIDKIPVYFVDQNRNSIWVYKYLVLLAQSQMFGEAISRTYI